VHVSTFFFVGGMVADFAFNSKLKSIGKSVQKMVTDDYLKDSDQVFKQEDSWYKDIKKDFIKINTFDDLEQYAIKITNNFNSDKWVILLHGYRGGVGQMSNYAKHYYENGYNILIPSLRGHSLSGTKYISFGWLDRIDILDYIDEIIKIDSNSKIVLHGLSMGASTVMMTTGEELPSNVKVAVSDCGYSSLYEEFYYLATDYLGIGAEPIISAVNYFAKQRLGFDINEISAKDQLKKSKTPTLFIHGGADTFVPAFMIDINYDAAINLVDGETKQKLIIDNAIHGMSAGVDEKLYWDTVWDFVGKFVIQ